MRLGWRNRTVAVLSSLRAGVVLKATTSLKLYKQVDYTSVVQISTTGVHCPSTKMATRTTDQDNRLVRHTICRGARLGTLIGATQVHNT